MDNLKQSIDESRVTKDELKYKLYFSIFVSRYSSFVTFIFSISSLEADQIPSG